MLQDRESTWRKYQIELSRIKTGIQNEADRRKIINQRNKELADKDIKIFHDTLFSVMNRLANVGTKPKRQDLGGGPRASSVCASAVI